MSAKNRVSYPKALREHAKEKGLHLITIEGGGLTVQMPVSAKDAKAVQDFAVKMFTEGKAKC